MILDELNASFNYIIYQSQYSLQVLVIILAILWTIFIISRICKPILLLGIIPRSRYGLIGIIFCPLLHADFNHIFFNSIPLIVLSDFILIYGINYYCIVTFFITFMSGVLIWCFAKPGLHIGASALITGYWGFLIVNMYKNNSLITIILGVISFYFFAGLLLGVLPQKKGVSWEGHLFGLLAGIISSYIMPLLPYMYR